MCVGYYSGRHNSESIDFCKWPYMVTVGNVFSGRYDEVEQDDHIQDFERKITDYTLDIEIR